MRVLIIEDTEDLGGALLHYLVAEGHAADWALDAEQAMEMLSSASFDVVALDLGLPGRSGTQLLEWLRRTKSETPVLVMTARAGIEEKIRHFNLGADDYLCKPFDLRELDARIAALLRRRYGLASSAVTIANLTFDGEARRVTVDGQPVELSGREYRLLEFFIARRGRIVSKEQILDQLFSFDAEVSPNVIELYVSRLRKKLESCRFVIRTVRGLGYVAEVGE
jgi:two-component system response regulator TctD